MVLLPELREGEFNAGLIMNEDGTSSHWLILNTAEHADKASHQEQMAWAQGLGLDLPTRKEQSLLVANAKQFFKRDWYWSNQSEDDSEEWAWFQDFSGWYQNATRNLNKLRARAVRRVPIVEV